MKQARHQLGELAHLLVLEPEGEGDFAALVALQAGHRVRNRLVNLLWVARGKLLDLHAALGRGNEHHAFETTIHEASEVKLARNGTRGFDKQPVHRLARGSGLGSHQTGPQKLAGGLLQFLASLDLPDASGLAAATGMNLRS